MKSLFFILYLIVNVCCSEMLLKLSKLVSNQVCRYDEDCKVNSFCYGNDEYTLGRCKCKENFILQRNQTYYECLEMLGGIGAVCLRDIQCILALGDLGQCDEKFECHCRSGAHFAAKECYKTVKLDDFCEVDYNCLLKDGTFAFCHDGRCTCNINLHPAGDKDRCIESIPLGKPCKTDESCEHTHAACYGVCKCMAGYIESNDRKVCLKAADQFGDPCVEQSQCSEYLHGSFCMNKQCSCEIGDHGYGNQCFNDVNIGGICSDRRECVVSALLEHSVDCVEGVCKCLTVTSDNIYGCAIGDGAILIGPALLIALLSVANMLFERLNR